MSRVWSYEVVRRTSAPSERVQLVLSDLDRWPEWAPGVTTAGWEGGGEAGPGSAGAIRRIGGRGFSFREQVVASTPGCSEVYTVLSGLPVQDYRGEVGLRPDDTGTSIVWSGRFKAKVPGTGLILRLFIRSGVARTVKALAHRAERPVVQ